MRAAESVIVGLRCLDKRARLERSTNVRRQFFGKAVTPNDALDIGDCRRIWQRRPRSERSLVAFGHIGYAECDLHRIRCSEREPSALRRREVLANCGGLRLAER